jgi:hypothetical protein
MPIFQLRLIWLHPILPETFDWRNRAAARKEKTVGAAAVLFIVQGSLTLGKHLKRN